MNTPALMNPLDGGREFVKICGLRQPEHAVAAVLAGADVLGFIFAPARRQVSAETAKACIVAARAATDRAVLAVGVFVDASQDNVRRTADAAGLDLVQLSGSESPGFIQTLGFPAIKALRPQNGASLETVQAHIDGYLAALTPPAAFLVDAYSERAAGGTGERADWGLAAEISATIPMLLAGGLDPENVGTAIRQVRPLGVDVSSGVEMEGVKSVARITAFVYAARQAFSLVPAVLPAWRD